MSTNQLVHKIFLSWLSGMTAKEVAERYNLNETLLSHHFSKWNREAAMVKI